MENLGKKVTLDIIHQIGDDNLETNEIYHLNEGIYNNRKAYIIDSFKKEEKYTGYIIGIGEISRNNYVYLIRKNKNKYYSYDYLRGIISFLPVKDVYEYVPKRSNYLPQRASKDYWDHYICTIDGENKIFYNYIDAFSDIICDSFYYSFDTHVIYYSIKDNKRHYDDMGTYHSHEHAFEEVVRELYRNPESFRIKEDEKEYYSNQEIKYLRRLKSFLLAIGVRDLKVGEYIEERIKANKVKKIKNFVLKNVNEEEISKLKANKKLTEIRFGSRKYPDTKNRDIFLRNNDIIIALGKINTKTFKEDEFPRELLEITEEQYQEKKEKYIKSCEECNIAIKDFYIEYVVYDVTEFIDQEKYFEHVV